jgi:hypothetical protein
LEGVAPTIMHNRVRAIVSPVTTYRWQPIKLRLISSRPSSQCVQALYLPLPTPGRSLLELSIPPRKQPTTSTELPCSSTQDRLAQAAQPHLHESPDRPTLAAGIPPDQTEDASHMARIRAGAILSDSLTSQNVLKQLQCAIGIALAQKNA